MLTPEGETTTKKILKHYTKLQAEGVPEDQIIEKCAAAVEGERRKPAATSTVIDTVTSDKPKSATQQVLAEADIKNIFKEK